jgi:hypothetical protein
VLNELSINAKILKTKEKNNTKNAIIKKNKQLILLQKPSFLCYSPTDIFTNYKVIYDFINKT